MKHWNILNNNFLKKQVLLQREMKDYFTSNKQINEIHCLKKLKSYDILKDIIDSKTMVVQISWRSSCSCFKQFQAFERQIGKSRPAGHTKYSKIWKKCNFGKSLYILDFLKIDKSFKTKISKSLISHTHFLIHNE